MKQKGKSRKEVLFEIEDLRLRLDEAEETLRAIRKGEVDAVVCSSPAGDQIYTLKGAEYPYRLFFEAMNEGAVTLTPGAIILHCNRRFSGIVNVPIGDITGMSFLDFVPDDLRQSVSDLISGAGPERRGIESVLKTGKEKVVPVNISVNSFQADDAERLCMIVTDLSDLRMMKELVARSEEIRISRDKLKAQEDDLRNSRRAALNVMEDAIEARRLADETSEKLRQEIAERMRIAQVLRESEYRYRSLFKNMIEGFAYHQIVLDGEGNPVDYIFLEVNDAFEELTGLKKEDVIGKRVSEVLPGIENDPVGWIGIYGKVALTGEDAKFENYSQLLHKWFSVSVYSAQKGYFAVVFEDITGRKQLEEDRKRLLEEVRAEKDKLSTLVASIRDEIWYADTQNRFTLINPAALRRFIIGAEDVINVEEFAASLEIMRPDGTPRPTEEAPPLRALRGEVVTNEEEIVRTPSSGELRYRQVSSAPVKDGYGNIIGSVSVVRDITEHKKAEEELKKSREDLAKRNIELEILNRDLEAFSYTVSHDLKAPLRSIQGFAKAVFDDYNDRLDDEGKDFLKRIIAGGERMSQLIDAMLDMARLTGRDIISKPVDLSLIAEAIANELRQNEPDREVEFVITRGMRVQGDMDMLEIVLRNLIDNSWKFTSKHKSAKIEFGKTGEGEGEGDSAIRNPQSAIVYFVRDDGAGFKMEFADKLFIPFRRLHREAEFPGLGIGLATVRKIINKHGGNIWVESEPEKGATFYFTLK